jgi:preprotein translocase subunit SecE
MANGKRRGGDDEERRLEAERAQQGLDRDAIAKSRERTPPKEYMREVRGELRKVAWPNREEVVNYTIVVLVATLVLIGIIFVMDFVFGRLTQTMFG